MQGVDVQNQPWAEIHPIPSGEDWLCDIATHLKSTLRLGAHNIAVITGGISGAQSVDGIQNFPDSAFDCEAVDIIGIHGYYKQAEDGSETAGTPWAKMFVPGNTLTARAKGREELKKLGKKKEEGKRRGEGDGRGKLLLVEEWSYVNTKLGLTYKKQSIFDQGNALNWRGIPWVSSAHLFLWNPRISTSSILVASTP